MESIIFVSIGFLILLSIVYFIPLGIPIKGKTILLVASLFVAAISLLSLPLFQWWYILILLITLSGLLTILLQRVIKSDDFYEEQLPESPKENFLSDKQKSTLQSIENDKDKHQVIYEENAQNEESMQQYDDIQEMHDYVLESSETEHELEYRSHDSEGTVHLEEDTDRDHVNRDDEKEESRIASKNDILDEGAPIKELSPEEELLAARQQTHEKPKQDREFEYDSTPINADDFVINEFKQEDLEHKDLKEQFEDREGFESFDIDIIEERDIPSPSSDILKEDRDEFTDLEDLLNQRDDDHGQ